MVFEVPHVFPIAAINYITGAAKPLPPGEFPHIPQGIGVMSLKDHFNYVLGNFFFFLYGLAAYTLGPRVEEFAELSWGLTGRVVVRDLLLGWTSFALWHWLTQCSPLESSIRHLRFTPSYPMSRQTLRDCFLTTLGFIQCSFIEVGVYHWWARHSAGFHPLIHPAGSTAAWYGDWRLFPVWTIVSLLLVGPWRDFHFYFVHRGIHPWRFRILGVDIGQVMYTQFHSLHHKSYNPNAWNGMGMHPVEHFIYFSCAWLPPLLVTHHPLVFAFNKWHLLIAPIAGGHDGLNAHHHWLHHAHFEVNYGSPLVPLDKLFGTHAEGADYAKNPHSPGAASPTHAAHPDYVKRRR